MWDLLPPVVQRERTYYYDAAMRTAHQMWTLQASGAQGGAWVEVKGDILRGSTGNLARGRAKKHIIGQVRELARSPASTRLS